MANSKSEQEWHEYRDSVLEVNPDADLDQHYELFLSERGGTRLSHGSNVMDIFLDLFKEDLDVVTKLRGGDRYNSREYLIRLTYLNKAALIDIFHKGGGL